MVTAQTALPIGLPARRSGFQQSDMISIADLSPSEIHEIFDMARKNWQILIEVVFVDRGDGASFNMNNTYGRTKIHDLWGVFVCPTGEDINVNVTFS